MGRKKIYWIVLLLALLILPVSYIVNPLYSNGSISITDKTSAKTTWCFETTGDFEGRKTPASQGIFEIIECGKDNVVYNDGLDALADDTMGRNNFNFTFFYVCNNTNDANCANPVAGQSEAFTNYNSCGLVPGATNISLNDNTPGTGNVTLTITFTSTCDARVVRTVKLGDFASGRNLSGNSFTNTTLNNNDQIRLNSTFQIA